MASIFSYEAEPSRVSSPWLSADESDRAARSRPHTPGSPSGQVVSEVSDLLSGYGVTKLEAEPQEGPTEYKLHLLLRPRRKYTSMTTTYHRSSSHPAVHPAKQPANLHDSVSQSTGVSTFSHSRQSRLEQLTTQLLWRLQQSSPRHSSSARELMVPKLPSDDDDLTSLPRPDKLPPGLEESRGALYEIGVADDGTLVGLTEGELKESLVTLQVMASSLRCNVQVLRQVLVGNCEWTEDGVEHPLKEEHPEPQPLPVVRREKLWVVEALVTPDLDPQDSGSTGDWPGAAAARRVVPHATAPLDPPRKGRSTAAQLRITLTGPTTSGKSSLLGTLSTGTLDNGHGTSRLSLLKHRHEVRSGVTSSVAQELIGYRDAEIFNYAHGAIESWLDIHDQVGDGRLVFVSDSAGHTRYRRTILRGLIGWAPHWTILCIAGDDGESAVRADEGAPTSGNASLPRNGHPDAPGYSVDRAVDLTRAHLDLCLRLEAPLVVVITKLDLATKSSLQRTVGNILSSIKAAGRTPRIVHPDQKTQQMGPMLHVLPGDHDKIAKAIEFMDKDESPTSSVPILLTSAVTGVGIGLVHALLEKLPVPPPPTARDFIGAALNPEQPKCLFHIDDKFSLPVATSLRFANSREGYDDRGVVVSGYLRFGSFDIGDRVVVGPFPPSDDNGEESTAQMPVDKPYPSSFGLSVSHYSSTELGKLAARNAVSASTIKGEWHSAEVVSIRNLRLPVMSLDSGQAGTLGLLFDSAGDSSLRDGVQVDSPPARRIRKGMVVAIPSKHMSDTGVSLQAASGLTVMFKDPEAATLPTGSLVNLYVASVRAAAKVSKITKGQWLENATTVEESDDVFNFQDQADADLSDQGRPIQARGAESTCIEVSFELLTNREWVELGSQVFVLDGPGKDRSALEGFVGKVTEIVD